MLNGKYSMEEAYQALRDVAQAQIDDPVEWGFLGRIPGDDDSVFEFLIPWKPGYVWCRIETALGQQVAECISKVALDPYTRCKFVRFHGVLIAVEYDAVDAVRQYGVAGSILDVPGLPIPERGAVGPLDQGGEDVLNVGLLQLTELMALTATELTIASGAITVTQAVHTVDTQADAGSDDLDTINVTSTRPYFFWLRADNAARTVVVKHNTGNILTFSGSDITLDETYKLIACMYDPALSKVLVLGGNSGAGTLTLDDGSTTVTNVDTLVFDGGTLVDDGGGQATYTPPSGIGTSHSYVGYSTVGGSTENMVTATAYLKPVTLATDGLLTSIEAHIVANDAVNSTGLACWVMDDNAGVPGKVIALGTYMSASSFFPTDLTARWVSMPVGVWLPAGDYWLAVQKPLANGTTKLYFDTSGADYKFAAGGAFARDDAASAATDSTNRYSIRGSILT